MTSLLYSDFKSLYRRKSLVIFCYILFYHDFKSLYRRKSLVIFSYILLHSSTALHDYFHECCTFVYDFDSFSHSVSYLSFASSRIILLSVVADVVDIISEKSRSAEVNIRAYTRAQEER